MKAVVGHDRGRISLDEVPDPTIQDPADANRNHRPLIPPLLDMVATAVIDPSNVLTRQEPVTDAIEAYRVFDEQKPGWINVALEGLT